MFESVSPSTAQQLRSFIDRLERLEEEKRTMMETIKEVLQEAKGAGFD
ncbi:MAG: GapR family DNA-binding domain-containing protein, partial [Alphaproteobacteria bacterium]